MNLNFTFSPRASWSKGDHTHRFFERLIACLESTECFAPRTPPSKGAQGMIGKYFFIKTSMAVFGLDGAENGGFVQGGIDGGHFNSM